MVVLLLVWLRVIPMHQDGAFALMSNARVYRREAVGHDAVVGIIFYLFRNYDATSLSKQGQG